MVGWNRPIGVLGVRLVIGLLSFQISIHKIFMTGLASEMRWFHDLAAYFPDWVLRGTNIYCDCNRARGRRDVDSGHEAQRARFMRF